MSQSPLQNYMDGVPVKISEKYEPPPIISLPSNIYQRLILNNEEVLDPNFIDYDFSLERNVLLKLDELQKVRGTELENRRERIRKYDEMRIREFEEKQKQLLTAVSYPSTDDLSSNDDEEAATGCNSLENSSVPTTTVVNEKQSSTNIVPYSPSHQNFDTILKPTVVPEALNRAAEHYIKKSNGCNSSKINYSDFENDTSSPFDNIELKTINDLDILAQVLNISSSPSIATEIRKHSNNIEDSMIAVKENEAAKDDDNATSKVTMIQCNQSDGGNGGVNDQNLNNDNNFHHQYNNLVRTTTNNPHHLYNEQQTANCVTIGGGGASIPQQQLLQASADSINNSFYSMTTYNKHQQHSVSTLPPSSIPTVITSLAPNTNMNQQQQIITTTGGAVDFYNYNELPNNHIIYDNYLYNNYPLNYRNNSNNQHLHQPAQQISAGHIATFDHHHHQNFNVNTFNQMSYNLIPNKYMNNDDSSNNGSNSNHHNNKNKSKSVPDILKELNDEIRDSEIRRHKSSSRNQYHDLESYEVEEKYNEIHQTKITNNIIESSATANTFMKLSPSSQILAKNISSMGFPLERVCKLAERFGNDDKKIVEHLIPLSELLDLGFDESKISEALIKFDNNKEKALDFLIS